MMRRCLLFAGVLSVVFCAPAAAWEKRYGDVVIRVLPDLPQSTTHGYHEFPFQVTNESPATSHRVTLAGPATAQADIGLHSLRTIERTVTVGPRSSVRLALMQPSLPVFGSGLRVSIDGLPQRGTIPWSSGHPEYWVAPAGRYSSAHSAHRSRRILISQRLTEVGFPPHTTDDYQLLRAVMSIDAWSGNWLAYSGYDGVVATAEELTEAPAGVVDALWHYVEAGGSLLVLGGSLSAASDPGARYDSLGDDWRRWYRARPQSSMFEAGLEVDYVGFGVVLGAAAAARATELTAPQFERLEESWRRGRKLWERARDPSAAHRQLAVADDIEIPVRGLFLVVFVFTVLIGPVNLAVLSRRGKRMWLLWTIPAVSILTCAVVVLYVLVGEGLVRYRHSEGLTVLDQRQRRATTLGWIGYYATLTPGDGLRFDVDTEVSPVVSWAYGQQSGNRAVAWREQQHLSRGWLRARLPSYFIVRKNEPRRERVSPRRRVDGTLEALNGLGVDLESLYVAGAAGEIYRAGPLVAGSARRLKATGELASARPGVLRRLYIGDLPSRLMRIQQDPGEYLRAGTYIAIARARAFIEPGLHDLDRETLKTVIYGILEDDTFERDTFERDTFERDTFERDTLEGDTL